MFNTSSYRAGDTKLNINACSGGIYKTYRESWFMRVDISSNLAETLFRKEKCFYNPRTNEYSTNVDKLKDWHYYDDNIYEVIILQMIICGEGEVIAELILKDDFDRYFKTNINEKNIDDKLKEVDFEKHQIDTENE